MTSAASALAQHPLGDALYNNLLSIFQAWTAQGKISPWVGLWPVRVAAWWEYSWARVGAGLGIGPFRPDPQWDRLMADVRGRNQVTGFLAIPLAIIGWHTIAFPILWAAERYYHDRWERRSGVADAFGGA